MHKNFTTAANFIKNHERLLIGVLLAIIAISFGTSLVQRSSLIRPYEPTVWEEKYNKSQWVVPQSENPISDEALYIHVGQLLVEGHDPSLINAEMPPFGKYILGAFNTLTGYLGIYGIVFSALALLLMYFLNTVIFPSKVLALLPVALFSFDPIFTDQIAVGLLDSLYFCLLLSVFLLFLKKQYLLSAVVAGLFMATKSPFLIVVVYVTLFSFMFLKKELTLKRFIFMPLLTAVVYTLTHLQLFLLGHDLRYFLSVQNYMIHFYQTGAQGVFAAVVPLLLSGYWFTWFGENRFIREWSILWPTVSLLSIIASYFLIKEKMLRSPFFFLLLWCFFYVGFLCLTPIFPRYLLLLLPFLYNLSIWVLLPNTDSKS